VPIAAMCNAAGSTRYSIVSLIRMSSDSGISMPSVSASGTFCGARLVSPPVSKVQHRSRKATEDDEERSNTPNFDRKSGKSLDAMSDTRHSAHVRSRTRRFAFRVVAYLTILWCCLSAAFANQHRFACFEAPKTFTLCRGTAVSCPAGSDDNDAYTIESAPPGSVVRFSTVYQGSSVPAQAHFFGQGPTAFPNTRHVYNSVGETFSFSYTSTSLLNRVDIKAELENNGQPPPQILNIRIDCAPGPTTGSITIIKTAIGGNGAFSFSGTLGSFQITTVNGSGAQSFANLSAGTYTVSEAVPGGWTFTSLSCSSSSTISGTTATITLGAGQNVTCTYTNTAQAPGTSSITIVKSTSGTGDSTFSFSGTGSLGVFQITTAGGTGTQTFSNLDAGSYQVTENVPGGWTFVSLSCTGSTTVQGATANITLGVSQNVTCTYTDRAASPVGTGSITIVKSADGGDGTFTFSASGSLGPSFSITTSGGSGSRTFSNVAVGVYTVTENDTAGFNFANLSCTGDGNGNTTVSGKTATIGLDDGESITCTFVNTAKPAPGTGAITIVKLARGGDATFSFSGSGSLGSNFSVTTVSGSGSRFFNNLSPGNYLVSEIVPAQWQFTSLSCTGDVAGNPSNTTSVSGATATIGLDAGENIVCTYSNESTLPSPLPGKAELTIIKTTSGRDGAFGFTSTIPGRQSFTLTTIDAFASVSFNNLTTGSYVVSETALGIGWSLSDLSCQGGSASVNIATRSVTIAVVAGSSATCTFRNTFSAEFIQTRTSETIRNFMNRRADSLTSEEPDRNRFVRRLSGSVWGGADSSAPLSFSGTSEQAFGRFAFASSLSQIAKATAKQNPNAAPEWDQDIDIWVEGHYNHFTQRAPNLNRSGNFGIAYLGADYLLTPSLLVGALVQIDSMTDRLDATGIGARGTGWMAGPYVSTKISSNLFFDARVAWGQSTNTVNPFGLYADPFDTSRSLARANLTGNWSNGAFRVTPSIGVTYFREIQHGYTDSLGVFIPSQTIVLGRTTFGPEFAHRYVTADDLIVEPHVAVTGIYDFRKDGTMTIQGVTVGVQDFRAKLEAGLLVGRSDNYSVRLAGTYDGIGDRSLNVYGGQIWLNAPLNYAPAPAPKLAAPFSWTGFYVGAQLGAAGYNHRHEFLFGGQDAPGAEGAFNDHVYSINGGVFAGFNKQFGWFVTGVEGDMRWPTKSWSSWQTIFIDPVDSDDLFRARSRLYFSGSLRARAGYAWQRSLFYLTAGLAVGRVRSEVRPDGGPDADLPNTTYTNVTTRVGWTAGAGLEHAFTDHISGRIEFRYTDFGETNFLISDPLLEPDYGPDAARQSLTSSEITAGVSYKF
jgi:opacity protein-like surface antigen